MAMTDWITGVSNAGDATIHYLRTGGAKPAAVLLHGLTGSGACWRPVAHALENQFDVVMPDTRGHGHSSAPPNGYRYADHAGDVMALIPALELTSPVLVGHSMGGMTAALVASQFGAPISGLILIDPTFLTPARQREIHESDVAAQHRRLLAQTKDELTADIHRRHPHRSPEIVELLAAARLQTRLVAFDVLTPPNPDYRELVSVLRVPSLLVIGDAPVVSMTTAYELQRLNPRLRVEQIAGAGHGLPYDQPERLAAVVASFLSPIAAGLALTHTEP